MAEAELILDAKAALAEGPAWDDRQNKLIWVDINGYKVNVFDPATGENKSYDVGQHAGAAAVREDGGLILALRDGFYLFEPDTEKLTLLHDPEPHLQGNRFNDGKCDPEGRFWAGTMVLEGDEGDASLYRLDPGRRVETVLTGCTVANGLAWDTKKSVMYHIDTPTKKIRAYDYDPETGNLSNERTAVQVEEDAENPDGMTIDEDGNLWVAFFGGWGVSCYDPETGEELQNIPIPAKQVTSCAFGGENRDELFITTAREGIPDDELEDQPHAGGIFRVKMKVKGAPAYRFRE
ncbi:SMP-30/gluconolactonase/LRE family protein [Alkalicoccus saliphilus]|uniref:Regucalcin n=1 Tax=Alkalicoccus saliphilus TaxID=200989 RepID=A0A2T4U306_9BACI|nr:SMP-30/gluconolactonase/LRE family protein [Alkalicoccus saliphilus]PTL37784.1 SMP-30/gluconolaconase/LRE domain protein [Alkalicoccus saliphilus]